VPGTLETDSENVYETFSGVPGTDTSVPERYHERSKSETVPSTDTKVDRPYIAIYVTNWLV